MSDTQINPTKMAANWACDACVVAIATMEAFCPTSGLSGPLGSVGKWGLSRRGLGWSGKTMLAARERKNDAWQPF